MEAAQISLSGLDVEWRRLQVIAQNLANMNSTRGESGETFQPSRLVSGPDVSFSAALGAANHPLRPAGVHVIGVEAQTEGLRRRYEPNHPHADEAGFVSYPNVDHAAEMTLLIRASRAYEANLTAIGIAHEMYARAADLGRQT